jgi:hypothetical protein
MLRNNVKHGLIFNYYQIMFDGKRWYAWYQLDAEIGFKEEIEAKAGD